MSLLLSLLQEAAFKRKLKENKEIHPPLPLKNNSYISGNGTFLPQKSLIKLF